MDEHEQRYCILSWQEDAMARDISLRACAESNRSDARDVAFDRVCSIEVKPMARAIQLE
jgi:hypothetical protein